MKVNGTAVISSNNDFAYFIYDGNKKVVGKERRIEEPDIRNFRDVTGDESFRTAGANCFYPILIQNKKIIGFGEVCKTDFHPKSMNVARKDGIIKVYPIDPEGIERKWRFERNTVENILGELIPHFIKSRNVWDIKRRKTTFNFKTMWVDSRHSSNNHGAQLLNKIIPNGDFLYPKSIHTLTDCVEAGLNNSKKGIVLDYFAGSGTTGHAVINLNRENRDNNRQYILVEVGHYFHTVLLPRMKKVIYSTKWKNGRPEIRDGISQLFKHIRVESYEDTLDSLVVNSRQDLVSVAENKELAEDYQLRYALGEETTESASLVGKDFTDPFNYTLSVVRDGVRRDVKVDLAETFNYLLGLKLTSRRQIDDILTIIGTNTKGETCLILWRNLEKMNASKLEKWFTKYRKTFDDDLNLIYINGDHTLNALRKSEEKWEAVTTESVFRALMFEQVG